MSEVLLLSPETICMSRDGYLPTCRVLLAAPGGRTPSAAAVARAERREARIT